MIRISWNTNLGPFNHVAKTEEEARDKIVAIRALGFQPILSRS